MQFSWLAKGYNLKTKYVHHDNKNDWQRLYSESHLMMGGGGGKGSNRISSLFPIPHFLSSLIPIINVKFLVRCLKYFSFFQINMLIFGVLRNFKMPFRSHHTYSQCFPDRSECYSPSSHPKLRFSFSPHCIWWQHHRIWNCVSHLISSVVLLDLSGGSTITTWNCVSHLVRSGVLLDLSGGSTIALCAAGLF